MSKILSDKEIQKLVDNKIIDQGEKKSVRTNSYAFRIGTEVRFFSSSEKKRGKLGDILRIEAGDSALITGFETVDLRRERIDELYEGYQICAFLTPTTTLMREGIQLLSTKIDPGYYGTLNWTIRNSSVKPIELEMGEPIYKATFFLLSEDEELPEHLYGDIEDRDLYQEQFGLVESTRKVPVAKEGRNIISVSAVGTEMERLKESGFPYNFIATQLHQVGQDMEVVTSDFAKMDKSLKNLEFKVEKQNKEISSKIDAMEDKLVKFLEKRIAKNLDDFDNIVFRRIVLSGTAVITIILGLGSGIGYLINIGKSDLIALLSGIFAIIGLIVLGVLIYLSKSKSKFIQHE